MKRMTQEKIEKLECPAGKKSVECGVDPATYPGLRIRVTAGGPGKEPVRTWYLLYVRPTDRARVRLKLGRLPHTSLDDARKAASEHLRTLDRGKDPAAVALATMRAGLTVRKLMDLFEASKEFRTNTERTQEDYKRIFTQHLSALNDVPVTATDDIRRLVREAGLAKGETNEVRANRILKNAKRLFAWAQENDHIKAGEYPFLNFRPFFKEKARKRVYLPDEIRRIFEATGTESANYRAYWLLIWYTMAREYTVRAMEWKEIKPDPTAGAKKGDQVWHVPAEKMKARREEMYPLTKHAVAILDEMRERRGASRYVFPASLRYRQDGDKPMTLPAKSYGRIRTLSGVDDFHAHAIRHTVATKLSELGVPETIVSRCLSHLPVGIPGVTHVYNHGNYLAQRREALDTWGEHLVNGLLASEK